MQLRAAISGKLEEILEKELKNAELAVTKGVSSATGQFKEAMRKQVKSAKLGSFSILDKHRLAMYKPILSLILPI